MAFCRFRPRSQLRGSGGFTPLFPVSGHCIYSIVTLAFTTRVRWNRSYINTMSLEKSSFLTLRVCEGLGRLKPADTGSLLLWGGEDEASVGIFFSPFRLLGRFALPRFWVATPFRVCWLCTGFSLRLPRFSSCPRGGLGWGAK